MLQRRIGKRVGRMLAAGRVDQGRRLLATGLKAQTPGGDALGHRELWRHLAGARRAERLEQAIVSSTRRYAKRQETWLRHQLRGPASWLDASAAPAALAQGAPGAMPKLDGANTAWVLIATALVLFMTVPALALFYGGLVRSKNVLSVLMHCMAICCLVSVLWLAVGYSLAFDHGGAAHAWIG